VEPKKRLITNFISLSSVQVLNNILPFITVPYLVRVLGPEKFGLIAFSQSLTQYFILFTEYGFNLSATKNISVNRNNNEKIYSIFSAVMILKFVLMSLSFLLLCLVVFTVPKFRAETPIYIFNFGMVLANVLFPLWFFQGMERMKQVALLHIFAKSFFMLSIFFFIRAQSDYIYVPLINSLGFILSGLISLLIVFTKYGIKFRIPAFSVLKGELKEGWQIFISTIAINLFTASNVFMLGIFSSNILVGYYSAGEKIVKAAQGLLEPLMQTIYPYICKLASESKETALSFIRKIIKLGGIAAFFISLSLFILASNISSIVLGSEFLESSKVIQILSFSILLIFLNMILLTHTMLNFGYQKIRTKILFSASLINISLLVILIYFFKHLGAATAALLTEFYITCFGVIFLSRKGLKLIERRKHFI
jgi:PST family polysaccharide transporter